MPGARKGDKRGMMDARIPSWLQFSEDDNRSRRQTLSSPSTSLEDEYLDVAVFGQTVCDHIASGPP